MKRDALSIRLVFLSAVMVIISLLIGETSAAAEDERVELRLWKIPDKYAAGTKQKAERAIFERFFRDLHPEIEPVSSTGITLEGQESIDNVMMTIAGGTAPDVLYLNFRKTTTYIEHSLLYPLDEYWEEELNNKIDSRVIPIIEQEGRDGQKHKYALPYGSPIIGGLRYRKDLFKEAGLNPNRAPRNWEEFYEYAKALTKPEEGQYGWATTPGANGAYNFCNYIYMAGGNVVEQKDGKWQAVYNDVSGVRALEFFHKLVRGEWSRNGKTYKGVATNEMTYWGEGKVGMIFRTFQTETVFDSSENPDIIGIAPLPAGPGGTRGGEFNQRMLGINAGTTDKRVRDAAWEYIKFRASDDAEEILTKIYVEAGEGRFVNPTLLRKFGYDDVLKEVPKEWIKVNEEAMTYLNPEPYGRNCDMIYYELVDPVDTVWLRDDVDYQAVLDKAVEHTNEKLIGEIPPETMRRRRRIVGFVLIGLGLVLAFFFVKFVKITVQNIHDATTAGTSRVTRGRSIYILAALFMLPALASILVWQYYPLLRGLVIAFMDYRIMGDSKFIGLDNFVAAFWREEFWIAMKNTLVYVGMTMAMGFFLPVILALILNEIPRGTLFFRTVFYLPSVTTPAVLMLLWKQFYEPSQAGLINRILSVFGVPAQTWLGNPNLAMACVIVPGIWAGAGAGCIIYLAALKSVPEELYEAAALDGASLRQKVWHVTFPRIKILFIINFVGAFIGAFHAAGNILIMTGGGPLKSTHVLGIEIFYSAYVYLKFGYATAVAWILGSLLIGFTVYQLRILRSVTFTTAK